MGGPKYPPLATTKIMMHAVSKQTLIQLSGKLASTLLGLVVVAIMTRGLQTAGFGQYTTVVAFLQAFGIVIDFGLTMTVGRELGRGLKPAPELIGNLVSFRVITAAAAFALAPLVAFALPYPLIIKIGITLSALGFLAGTLSQTLSAVFQAQLKSGWLVGSELGGRLVLLAGVSLAALCGANLYGYLTALLLANIATCVVAVVGVQKSIPFTFKLDLKVWGELWRSTWPVAVSIAFNLIYFKADTLILSLIKPAADVGLYGAAYKVLEVLLAIPAIIGGLVLPLAARAHQQNNNKELASLYSGTFDSLLAACLAIIAGSLTVGIPLIVLLAGPGFATAGNILMILSLATAAIFLSNASGYFIFALGKQRQVLPLYAVASVIALAGYAFAIPRYSYWGAAWMTVVVELLVAAVNIGLLWRWGLQPKPTRWVKILLLSVALMGSLLLPVPLLLKLVVAAGIYGLGLWQLKLIPQELATEIKAEL